MRKSRSHECTVFSVGSITYQLAWVESPASTSLFTGNALSTVTSGRGAAATVTTSVKAAIATNHEREKSVMVLLDVRPAGKEDDLDG